MTTSEFPDERLKLLFVCAHPAIDAAMHTPLMLQTVLGLNAIRIASAFLVSPDAMGRRLSRAKAKIRDAAIPFEVPAAKQLAPRLHAVLEAIYAAYGSGWDDLADPQSRWLPGEAITIGRTLVELMPDEPEALGLLSLMLHCEARREARRDDLGDYVPLSEQDVARWSQPMIEEAEVHLAHAARAGRIGPFQLEAAIQSAHAQRAVTGATDWEAISLLYEGLVRMAPTIGALVGRAAAVAEARGAEAGLKALEELPPERIATYQPYWALIAHLLGSLGALARSARRLRASHWPVHRRRHARLPDRQGRATRDELKIFQWPSKAISVRTGTSSASSFLRPPRSGRSMTKQAATMSAPIWRKSLTAPSAVPPVAIRSSTRITFSPGRDRVLVHLHLVEPVFQAVGDAHGLVRQLALLADRDEAGRNLVGDGAAEDEAARLDAGDLVDLLPGIGMHQLVDGTAERARIAEQRGDVAKQDARLGIVGDRADRRDQEIFEGGVHAWHPVAG